MRFDQHRQTTVTQMPLSFASFKSPASSYEVKEREQSMSLAARIQRIIDDMPPPVRGRQVRLAKIADVSKQMVNHWLRNVSTEIQYEPARRICDHFGYRMDWLVRGKGPMRIDDKDEEKPTAETMALVYLTAEEQQIITDFRSTDEIGRTIIKAAAAKMKKD